jgi:hypothetical protein
LGVARLARLRYWLCRISRGQGTGVPNSLGVRRNEPEQVRDSTVPFVQSPREPVFWQVLV